MPDNIKFQNFDAGWIPSDDEIRGRKNGFLQFDNVDLDKNGAVTMAGGCQIVGSPYGADLHTLYSTFINGAKLNYGCDSSGQILRNNTIIKTGGDSLVGCFGTAFDYVLACSGDARIKDNGTNTYDLGIVSSTNPPIITVNSANAPRTAFASVLSNIVSPTSLGSHAVITSDPRGHYVQLTANDRMYELTGTGDGTGVACLQTWDVTPPVPDFYNLNNLQGIGPDNVGYATENDYIVLSGYLVDPWGKGLQFDVMLEESDINGTMVQNYYRYVVHDLATEAEFASNGVFTIRMRRSAFERIGSSAADWTTVYGFRLTFFGNAFEIINIFGTNLGTPGFVMIGGSKTQDGTYSYMQINVRNDGSYVGKSPMSPETISYTIDMMQAFIQPRVPSSIDPQANEAWIYRRGGLLDKWYLVKVFDSNTGFDGGYDTFSDVDALKLNIPHNEALISIASSSIAERIQAIIGPLQGRWYYFTDTIMYPSDINSPDLVDPTLAVRLTSSTNELFYWALQVGERSILIGTSQDIYLLSGTFITQPDFSVDLYYSGFGCEYPPIVKDASESANGVFYLAKDGWRLVGSNGETMSLVSPNLDRLYRGIDCYGYIAPDLKITPNYLNRFPVIVARNRLWCFMNGTGRCEVYDFMRKYWRVIRYGLGDVGCAFSTQDGQVLCFYRGDYRLREIDLETTKLIDNSLHQEIRLKTPVLDNDTPRQRKDSYTLILHTYTSAYGILNVQITGEDGVTTTVGNITSPQKVLDRHIDISRYYQPPSNLRKSYQLTMSGTLDDFNLSGAEITFDTRPLPVSYLRVQSMNFGTASKKRLYSIPFQMDTMGYSVTLTPLIDNIASAGSMILTSSYKRSFSYKFVLDSLTSIKEGFDYEFVFDAGGGLFEFFGFNEVKPEQDIEVLPTLKLSHVIPMTNFGTANKKRLRVWPFVIDTNGGNVIFQPVVDDVLTTPTTFRGEKGTYFHFYKTDVFGVDYGGVLYSETPFELYNIMQPEIVQVLPIAKQFDQVGPLELFKYGKVKQMEIRVHPFNTVGSESVLPFNIYFNDNSTYSSSFTIANNEEASYFVGVPKGTNGNIVRIELGPTNYDFHRFYIRLQVAVSGRDTEEQWVTVTGTGSS